MSERQTLWVEDMCRLLAPIERETQEKLGEQKGRFFIQVANDWLKINSAFLDAYPGEQVYNLVLHAFWGLFRSSTRFQFFFVSGNYPLLLSRLRFVWESAFVPTSRRITSSGLILACPRPVHGRQTCMVGARKPHDLGLATYVSNRFLGPSFRSPPVRIRS